MCGHAFIECVTCMPHTYYMCVVLDLIMTCTVVLQQGYE